MSGLELQAAGQLKSAEALNHHRSAHLSSRAADRGGWERGGGEIYNNKK